MDEHTENNSEAMVPKAELDKCAAERDEYLSGWQRAKADFVNYKKEEMQRVGELARYRTEDIIRDLIVVMDSFDLGLAALEKQGTVEKGIYMIRSQIEDILRQRGAEKIPLVPGDAFDPRIAEVISEEASSDHPPGTILRVVSAGYKLSDKVIQPARVTIVKENSE